VALRCPSGDDFGTIDVPEESQPGDILFRKRCRSHRCRIDGKVTFHEFDPVTFDPDRCDETVRTWHLPYRHPRQLAERLKEMNNNGHELR